ncbi:MAG: DNA-processing protein DprA [Xanthomonadales bacterium]|nr:DNA-processing protein DprA [Xanthomonadales bacterium]
MATASENRAWLHLLRAPGLGAERLRGLVERHGSASAALAAAQAGRAGQEIPVAALSALRGADDPRIEADLDWLTGPGNHLLTWLDEDYPALLREASRPPAALFVRGDPGLLWHPQLAMVGSRNPTAGGADTARAFAATLAGTGLLITSGLASGIDAAAHRGAMQGGGRTIAVVGTGVDVAYPASHAGLMAEIAASGAVVSEFPLGTAARPPHFPLRNRIIAGLSLGTFVVEAALRSGSLITARMAGEAGREVFALPGSIHNPMARGCHRLIRDGARLVETAGEILEELRPLAQALAARLRAGLAAGFGDEAGSPVSTGGPLNAPDRLADPDYKRLWQALGHDPQPVDVLATRSGLTTPQISSMLLLMELDGLITVGANGRYCRADRTVE